MKVLSAKNNCWRDCQSAAGLWTTGRQTESSRISKSADVACMTGQACKALCCADKRAGSDLHGRFSTTHGEFHTGFDPQVFGYALDDHAKVPRCGVAIPVEHSMQGFFAQAGLPRQFFKTNFGVDKVAQYGKSNSGFTLQKAVNRFRVKCPRKSRFTLYPCYNRFGVISCRNHFIFRFV